MKIDATRETRYPMLKVLVNSDIPRSAIELQDGVMGCYIVVPDKYKDIALQALKEFEDKQTQLNKKDAKEPVGDGSEQETSTLFDALNEQE